jgi:hypothetical protein
MQLRKPMLIATGIGAATTAGVVTGLASPAAADSPVIYSGGSADCAGQWLSGSDDFRVMDRTADGNSCYVHAGNTFDEAQNGRYRFEHGGADGEWHYDRNPDLKGWQRVYLRVCENVGGGPDSCSNITGPWSL